MTRNDIRELSQIRFDKREDCAFSFYFQPQTPHNKSHREESILAKDLVRQALREMKEKSPQKPNGGAATMLERILDVAGNLHADRTHAKAVFACARRNFWREFDLPPHLPRTQLFVGGHFLLRPLAEILGAQPRLGVVLVDRQRARLFDLRQEELTEHQTLRHRQPGRGRGDSPAGYDAGHSHHRLAEETLHHFKQVASRLKEQAEAGVWDKLVIGCHANHWAELESHLHPYVKQRLLGHFSADPNTTSCEQVRKQAWRIFQNSVEHRRDTLVKEAISPGRGNWHNVTGLRRVLRSLELGQVQTMLIGENYTARAVECTFCGHLDSHLVGYCPLCGHATRELEDVCNAIIATAVRRDIELLWVKDHAELDRVGNIAALLRYRGAELAARREAS